MHDIQPLCCGCGSLRRTDGTWDRSADFRRLVPSNRASHGICSECLVRLYPDLGPIVIQRRNSALAVAANPAGAPLF